MGQHLSTSSPNDDAAKAESKSKDKAEVPMESNESDEDEFMDASDDLPIDTKSSRVKSKSSRVKSKSSRVKSKSSSVKSKSSRVKSKSSRVKSKSSRVKSKSSSVKVYDCQVCGKKVTVNSKYGKSRFIDHALNHSQTKYFKCKEPNCGVELHTKRKIEYHYSASHGIESVRGYSFKSLPFEDKDFQNDINRCFGNQVDIFKTPVITRSEKFSLVKNFKKLKL
ncbi:hypothetical protein CAEBREN_23653 [Caenorhabditis brenneri]|uniref:C2H2-type domain-containing protein n=1 Tax=Caenorhabditis brenneri TaxID=135651 RepID=G0MYB6_CAEBE|nr:hypothetical protein CAEBREN_23653 [Caenorhabditis brenneri]